MCFGLTGATVVTTSSGQAHAAPLAIAGAALTVVDLASSVAGAFSASSPSTGVGDVPYYGSQTYNQGGSLDNSPPRISYGHKTGGRAGALVGLAATLGSGLAAVVPWAFGSSTPTGYADAPATDPNAGTKPVAYNGQLQTIGAQGKHSITCAGGNCSWYREAAPAGLYLFRFANTGSHLGLVNAALLPNPGSFSQEGATRFHLVNGNSSANPSCAADSNCYGVLYAANAPTAPTGGPAGATTVTTTTTSSCSSGGSTSATVSYTRNTTALPPIVIPGCAPGATRTGVSQTSTTPDGRTVADPLGDWTRPAVPAAYPECLSTPCAVELVKLTPGFSGTPDSQPYVCNGRTGCEGALDPAASPRTGTRVKVRTPTDTSPATDPAAWPTSEARPKAPNGQEYECRYGPYRVPVAECSAVPIEPPVATPAPPTGDPRESNCNLSDVSFNPISWVVVPLKCLFIPRQSVVNGVVSDIGGAWSGSAPDTAVDIVVGMGAPFAELPTSKGSCGGPEVVVPIPIAGPTAMRPFNACLPLIELALSFVIPLVSAGLYLGAARRAASMLASSVGTQTL